MCFRKKGCDATGQQKSSLCARKQPELNLCMQHVMQRKSRYGGRKHNTGDGIEEQCWGTLTLGVRVYMVSVTVGFGIELHGRR